MSRPDISTSLWIPPRAHRRRSSPSTILPSADTFHIVSIKPVQDGDIGATSTVHGGLHAKEDRPFPVTQCDLLDPCFQFSSLSSGRRFNLELVPRRWASF